MDIIIPLDQMTVAEKLRAIETIWEDLQQNPANIPSPAWHEKALRAPMRHHGGQVSILRLDRSERTDSSQNPMRINILNVAEDDLIRSQFSNL